MKIKVPLNRLYNLKKKHIDNLLPFKRQLRLFFPHLVLEFQFREPV